ncbi:MAG TPA: biotin-dependent carboxyltransferase family protein [Chthoniobacterales bacterium]|jgi:antagonist of KipI|nr:biotin-dependent carboxyltransferase family protein [Chthoniobacterales bacterium]HEV3393960.1 biotin-dependent carboxyltransferase family protein [Chthoniobacterales bacterium]
MNATAIRAGFLTSVQDLGRTGLREFGVSLGGALDGHGLRVANILVGNDELAAGLETTFGGLRLRFADERIIAWCGGDFDAHIGSTALPSGHPGLVRGGEEFFIESPTLGCRAWVAISGGIDVPVVLASRSADLRAGFGGATGRLARDGQQFPLGTNTGRSQMLVEKLRDRKIASWKPPHDWSSTARREPTLRFIRGSDSNRFTASALEHLTTEAFVVSPDSDRMGVRLDGPALERSSDVDLLSEAVAPGTVQVPPSGKPILLLNDCQTIGGYPKIAHVITVDLGIAAQLRVGDRVRFREVWLADAHRALLERERDLQQFRHGIGSHFK